MATNTSVSVWQGNGQVLLALSINGTPANIQLAPDAAIELGRQLVAVGASMPRPKAVPAKKPATPAAKKSAKAARKSRRKNRE